jgi:cytochrome c oxidase assembly protein subunit 15
VFLAVALSQGGIGYLQYFTGLPEVLVAMHLVGAVLVWIAAWNLVILGNLMGRKLDEISSPALNREG